MLNKQEVKISRIVSTLGKGVYNIHVYGYDKNNKFTQYTDTFKNYFYFNADSIDDILDEKQLNFDDTSIHETLYGDKVFKVYYSSIKLKNKLKKLYRGKIHEADVSPEFRYVLANKLEYAQDRHVLYYDIETWYDPNDSSLNKPDKVEKPITAILTYSSIEKQYYVFSWNPDKTAHLTTPEIKTKDNINYVFCKDEEDVFNGFIQLVKQLNVDILAGWYSSGYDLPYIMNRGIKLGIDIDKLSPVGKTYIKKRGEYWRTSITGIDHIDMIDALQDLRYKGLPNNKLSTAAKVILPGKDIEKLEDVTWKDWLTNYEGFLEYGVRDVEILHEIESAIGAFNTYYTIQNITGMTSLNTMFYKSMIVDLFLLKEEYGKQVMPSRATSQRQDFKAAIVINPTDPGVHADCFCVDYTSLYPTTIMAFNLSPETYITSQTDCEKIGVDIEEVVTQLKADGAEIIDTGFNDELFGKRYLFYASKSKAGMYPRILRELFLKRKDINRRIKLGEFSGDELTAKTKQQGAYKLILNSSYGALGFSMYRLYKPEVADAITYFAREALKFAMVCMNNDYGMEILYGDTDSCFAKSGGRNEDEVVALLDKFNYRLKTEFVERFTTSMRDDYFLMDLKFEYDLEYAYFGSKKKRYYTIVRGSGKKYIRGMNIIRKDTPTFMKAQLDTIAEKAVRGTLVLQDILNLETDIKTAPYNEIGINKSYNRRFDQYNVVPQHVRGAQWANKYLPIEITNADTPLLFYITPLNEDDLKPKERQKAIVLREEDLHIIDNNAVFEIDYGTFFKKQVLDQVEEFAHIPNVKTILANWDKKGKFIDETVSYVN